MRAAVHQCGIAGVSVLLPLGNPPKHTPPEVQYCLYQRLHQSPFSSTEPVLSAHSFCQPQACRPVPRQLRSLLTRQAGCMPLFAQYGHRVLERELSRTDWKDEMNDEEFCYCSCQAMGSACMEVARATGHMYAGTDPVAMMAHALILARTAFCTSCSMSE